MGISKVVVSTLRSHPMQLPTSEEIKQMMAIEAKCDPSTSKHFPDFSVANEWLELLKVESDLFLKFSSIVETNDEVEKIKSVVVERTLRERPMSLFNKIEGYLGEEDKLEKCEVAIVFGGKTLSRANKGAQMYLDGWVEKLLMTGKGPVYKGVFKEPEAIVFKKRAMELGVSEEKILTECESINIPSNVRASLNLLDELGIKYKTVMQIISWYANRRAWVTLKKYVEPGVRIIRVNPDLPKNDGKPNGYDRGEWYKTGEGIEIVFNEFVKMVHQVVTDAA